MEDENRFFVYKSNIEKNTSNLLFKLLKKYSEDHNGRLEQKGVPNVYLKYCLQC